MDDFPKKFSRYELLELLATGGMAHIYRAQLTSAPGMTKELVIKRVLPHLAQNRDFIDMFVDEARITMPLNHGNIVQVFEFGQDGQDYFLAMEYVRGRNLETVLTRLSERGLAMPVPVALFIGSEIAKGLDYAHRFRDPQNQPIGIIHRDVSPQNVLVGFQGEIKLTDFGIAKARSKVHQTSQGVIRGKAVYLSPEQAECQEMDARSDQFSLGSVQFEMLTGVRPFEGQTEVATLQKVRLAQVQAPSRLRSDVPTGVDAAVLKALAREPGRRFDSCGAFQVALGRSLADQSPDFTSSTLAEWISELFSVEITHEINQRTTREHLLAQMDQQGGDGSKLTTGEMLEMGTMTIQTGDDKPPKAKWIWKLLLVLVGVLGLGLGAWFGWLAPNGHTAGTDAGLVDAGPAEADGAPVLAGADPPDAGSKSPADAGPPVSADPGPAADGGSKPDQAKPPPRRWAYLNLNASPWAQVELDGHRLKGETPLFKVRVRAGKHRLRFFNPGLNIEKVKVIRIKPGQTRTISVELTP